MRKLKAEAPITAKEIGRQLGLSQPTVSRILAGTSGYRVAGDTRQRVLEAAMQAGYRPNALARSLRRGRTNIVGFYTGYGYLDARNPFQAELIGGLQRAADSWQIDILLHGVFRGTSTDDIYGELVDGRVDGLFINTRADDPLVARLRTSSLPVVALADGIEGIPSIVADDRHGVELLLAHLWERGHERIGFIRPSARFASVEERFETFCRLMQDRGMDRADIPVYEAEFEFTESVLDAILSTPNPPTAVCCWNDTSAFDLIYHCRKRGVNVPQDLAITGFDGLYRDPRMAPRELVTVGASWSAITQRAMELLMAQITSRNPLSPKESEEAMTEIPLLDLLPVSLVGGDTV